MLDLFKEVTHSYNFTNSLQCGSYKIKTVRYGTETITYHGPKIWSITSNGIKGSASLETFHQKMIVVHIAFAKNILQLLALLIFHEFHHVFIVN